MINKTLTQKEPSSALRSLPILIERDEDGFYLAECPVFAGCFTQGKTIDEALKNIREVIELVLEEPDQRELFETYRSTESGVYSLTIRI